MKALAWAGWAGVLATQLYLSAPLYGEDTDAAARQYNVAESLHKSEAYDLAADAWGAFLKAHPDDSRASRARHYQGVCYFMTAVAAIDARQTDAALKALDAAEQDFQAVLNAPGKLEHLEDTYLYLGLSQLKRAENVPADRAARQYEAAAATFDTFLKKYPQGNNLAQVLYDRGDCAYHLGQKDSAVHFYADALTKSPDAKIEPSIMYGLGVAQQELKQWDAAGKTYDDFLKKYNDSPLASGIVLRRAEMFLAAQQYQPAAEWFAAAAARPGFELADQATIREAVALAKLGKPAEAGDLLAGVFTKYPKSPRFPHVLQAGDSLARGLINDRKAVEAAAMAEKLLPLAEGREEAAALALDRADAVALIPARKAESTALYRSFAAKYPKNEHAAYALYLAAFGAMSQGDFAAAVKDAEAFVTAYPKDELAADVGYVAAESQLKLAKYDEAEKLYADLLQKYSQRSEAENWLVRQGWAVKLQGKYAEAVALLQPQVAKIKNADARAEAYFLIGASQIEQKQYAEAAASLEAALAAAPRWRQADETLLNLGQAYYREKKAAKATEALQKLIADFPQSKILDGAHFRLGEYAADAGDPKSAEREFRLVVEKWPSSTVVPFAYRGLGWALFNQKEYAEAEQAFNTLVEKYPDQRQKLAGLYARGLARRELKKFAEAAADLQAFLNAGGMDLSAKSDTRYFLGLSLVAENKSADAAAIFRSLLSEDPKYPAADRVYYELAWALKSSAKEKDEKESVAAFADLIKQCPESPYAAESQFCVGDAAYKSGDYRAAAKSYAAALEKAGKTELGEKAAHKLGWAYYQLDDVDHSQQAFANQIATWPKGPLATDAAFMEAECLFKQKKFAAAAAAYDQVKGTTSKDFLMLALLHNAQAVNTQALAMLRPEQEERRKATWQKGLALVNGLIKDYPDTRYLPEALYERGWAMQNLGQFDEATAEYKKVVDKSGGEPAARAQFMIGQIQFQQKKYAEAVTSFYLVLHGYQYPQWQADASFEAAKCFEALHKKSQAVKQYQELIEQFPQSERVAAAKSRLEALKRD